MSEIPFKLMCESLGLSVKQVAELVLHLPRGSVSKYADGQRPTPPDVIEEMKRLIHKVDSAAHDFQHNPTLLTRAPIPTLLHKAVRRRIIELTIAEERRAHSAAPKK